MRRFLKSAMKWGILFAILVSVSAALVELGAYAWLKLFADEDQFVRFATLAQYRDRSEAGGYSGLIYVPHRYIGYVPAANHTSDTVKHNAHGFRGLEMPQEKPAGEVRIVCLGGSTSYAVFPNAKERERLKQLQAEFVQLGDKEQALTLGHHKQFESMDEYKRMHHYPGFLEMALRERGYDHVRVLNFSAMGYTTWESLATFQFRALDFDPDIVLVYHGYNDIHSRLVWPAEKYLADNSGSNRHSSGYYQPLPWHLRSTAIRMAMVATGRVQSPASVWSTFSTMEPTSQFWKYLTQITNDTYPEGIFQDVSAETMMEVNTPRYFRNNLQNLAASALVHDVTPVFLTFVYYEASKTPFNTELYREAIDEHNAVLQGLGSEMDFPVIDVAGVYPREEDSFADTIHFSNQGARIMADIVAEGLISRGIISPANEPQISD